MWQGLLKLISNPQVFLALLKDFGKVMALILKWYIQREAEKMARKREQEQHERDQASAPKEADQAGNGLEQGRDSIDDMLNGGGGQK